MNKKWIVAAFLVAGFLVSGCRPMVEVQEAAPRAAVEVSDHYPVTIETLDDHGEMVTETFTRPPERVVCIWQNSIENLLALGVGDRIVAAMGLPSGEYLRPEYQEVYSHVPYRSMEKLDMETVMMQEPDFIVGWASSFSTKTLRETAFWQGRGVHTYISPGSSSKVKNHTLDYEYQDILNLGKVFDREARAEELVNRMKTEISAAESRARANGYHPRGLIIEYLGKDISVYGERTLAGNILLSMGGELLGEGLRTISKEQLLELDPDALFVVVCENAYGNEDRILDLIYQETSFQGLKCVKAKRIYPLPLYSIYSAGVRAYDGIQIIGKGLYGEV